MTFGKLLLSAIGLLLFGSGLFAQQLFDWSYSASDGDHASGVFSARLVGSVASGTFEYQVTSVSGAFNSQSITSVLAIDTLHSNDNTFYFNSNDGTFHFSKNGLGFSAGDQTVALTGPHGVYGDGIEYVDSGSNPFGVSSISITEKSTTSGAPWEPSDVVVLLGFGTVAIQQIRKRSRRRTPSRVTSERPFKITSEKTDDNLE